MATPAQVTAQEVKSLAEVWYQKLDVHAPVTELLPMVDEEGLSMTFPEATLAGVSGFVEWYEGVIRKFFDEVHVVKEVATTLTSEGADVKVVLNWQARVWNPPSPRSLWLGFDAYQTWHVRRSPKSGAVVITRYVVDELRPMPGSASL